jgi:hypothetical protein
MCTPCAGLTVRLFENPYVRQRLLDMGLFPDTAFGCAMDFLFAPNAEVQAVVARERQRLAEPGALKIGIQIRTNDSVLEQQPQISDLAPWEPYFRCAQVC